MTAGPIWRQLAAFSLPLLAGSLVQQLYSTVDLMFVGQTLGTEAAAAIDSSSLVVTCLVGFFTGLRVGVAVTAARAVGNGDHQQLRQVVRAAAGLSLGVLLLFLAAGQALAPAILRAMHTPSNLFPAALTYLRLYLLSLPAMVIYPVGAGILCATGDSRRPTVYQLAGGLANVAGNWLFLCVLQWGIPGAAGTTFCAQSLAAALVIRRIWKLGLWPRRCDQCGEGRLWRGILRVGLPAAIQAVVISLSNLLIQSQINRLGVAEMAAFTVYFKVETLLYYPILALGQACTTFVSQNLGAGQPQRALQGVRVANRLGVGMTLALSAGVLAFSEPLLGLFFSSVSVIEIGKRLAWVAFPFYFLYVFLETDSALLRGAGKALRAMVIVAVVMCPVRLGILSLVMHVRPQAQMVAAIYPVTWLLAATALAVAVRMAGKQIRGVTGLHEAKNEKYL